MKWYYVFGFCSLVNYSTCIYTPYEVKPRKPALSPGIKTTNWRNPNADQIVINHNYSHVNYQYQKSGNSLTPAQIYESTTKKFYPIFRPDSEQNLGKIDLNEGIDEKVPQQKVIVRVKKQLQVYEKCPPGATGQFVYSLACNQFLNCWKGRGYPQNCSPGTLFNPDTLTCDFPEKVRCITGPRQTIYEESPSTLSHTVSTRDVQPGCPKEFSGRIPNYSNCSKFIVCMEGEAMNQICPPGTLFDSNRNICDFPKIAKCFNGENQFLHSQNIDYFVVGQSSQNGHGTNVHGYYQPMVPGYYQTQYGTTDRRTIASHQPTNTHTYCGNQNKCPGTFLNQPPQAGSTGGSQNCGSSNCRNEIPVNNGVHSPNYNQGNLNCDQYNHNCRPTSTTNQGFRPTFTESVDQTLSQSSNEGVPENPSCFPPNCVRHNNFPSSNTQTNTQGVIIPQYNCNNPTNPNCRQGSFDSSNISSRPNYSRDIDQTPDSSNVRIISRCSQNHNCRRPSDGNQQSTLQNHHGKNADNSNTESDHLSIGLNQGSSNIKIISHQNGGFASGYPGQRVQNQGSGSYQRGTGQYSNVGYNQNNRQNTHNQYDNRCTNRNGKCTPNQNSEDQYGNPGSGYDQNQNFDPNRGFPTHKPAQCPNGAVGLQPHPYDCSKFLNCANGQTFVQDCGPGTLFSPKMMICDFDYNVQCSTKVSTEISSNSILTNPRTTTWRSIYVNGDLTTSSTYLSPNSGYIHPTTRRGHYITSPPRQQNTHQQNQDYDDIGHHGITNIKPINPIPISQNLDKDNKRETTFKNSHKEKTWPPPFPATDTNADYVFEYYDADLEPNILPQNSEQTPEVDCKKDSFDCNTFQKKCIRKNLVCDGKKDCQNGRDEDVCNAHLDKFDVKRNTRLAIIEKERWDNTSVISCAYMCLESKKFKCRSFNYRKIDNCCLLSDSNEDITGRLMAYEPNDYYELRSSKSDCTNMFKCNNNKCIQKSRICDGQSDCGDREDEKNCPADKIGYTIRLSGGNNPGEGRIEVGAFGKLGFVCDDKFDIRDANVVCRELGYNRGAAEVKGNSHFAKNVPLDKIFYMMDDIICQGNETSVKDCDFNGWGSHDCTNQEVVGVICKTEEEKCPVTFWKCNSTKECVPKAFVCDGPEDCSDGSDEEDQLCTAPVEIRLVNGTQNTEGRVEVKYHGVWGTVCDDDFNDDAAKVVCKNLGFKGSVTVKKDAYFGQGVGTIWLDQVACFGNETKLEECNHWNWGEHNCDHSEDVGVICSDSYTHDIERHVKTISGENKSKLNVDPAYPIYPSTCGLRKNSLLTADGDVHFRVVQGSKAKVGDYPWQAALRVKGKLHLAHWCGAVVISSKFVLTAAHCLVGYPKGAYIVVAGEYNVQEDEGTEQQAYIEDYYIHEDFRKGHKMNNDIALVKLKGNGFKLNQDVQAICLPKVNTNYNIDLNCTISGFGSVQTGTSAFSNELRAGVVPLQPDGICKMPHVYGSSLTDGMLCAGTLDGGTDSCDGDSGGPLACLDEGFFTLYGITSWGQRCGYANKPGVYVKVAHYRKWIDDKIRNNI